MKYIGKEGILKVFTLYPWEQQHMASNFFVDFIATLSTGSK
jgi:hypothetical protein